MSRDYILLRNEWLHRLEALPTPQEFAVAIWGVMHYAETGEAPKFRGWLADLFEAEIRPELDRQRLEAAALEAQAAATWSNAPGDLEPAGKTQPKPKANPEPAQRGTPEQRARLIEVLATAPEVIATRWLSDFDMSVFDGEADFLDYLEEVRATLEPMAYHPGAEDSGKEGEQ